MDLAMVSLNPLRHLEGALLIFPPSMNPFDALTINLYYCSRRVRAGFEKAGIDLANPKLPYLRLDLQMGKCDNYSKIKWMIKNHFF